jgi:hypothetical protein
MSKRLSEVDDQLAKRAKVAPPLNPVAQAAQIRAQPKQSLAVMCNIMTMYNISDILKSKDVGLISDITYFVENNCLYANKFSVVYTPNIDNNDIKNHISNLLTKHGFVIIGDIEFMNVTNMFGVATSKTAIVNVSWENPCL